MEVNLMASRLKAALFITLLLMSLSGCSDKTEDSIIKEEIVLNNTTGEIDLPHIEGYITTENTGMQLWYDIFGDLSDPNVLLIHGADAQAISWRPHFYEPLVNAGFCVIRFDCRDNGLSEKFGKRRDSNLSHGLPKLLLPIPWMMMQMMLSDFSTN
jgi:hypothetical protein